MGYILPRETDILHSYASTFTNINSNLKIMKKIMLIGLALVFLAGYRSMAGTEKTVENLKTAFKAESTASAKYAAYARQARQEGLIGIAFMFDALSKSGQIHAANHQTVFEKMGQTAGPVAPEFTVRTTVENLRSAVSARPGDIMSAYPGFIATARDEDAAPAAKSFRWAMDTEKKQQIMLQNALNALDAKKTGTLPKVYWVCPKCGNTYDVAKPEEACAFCSTGSEKFIRFGK